MKVAKVTKVIRVDAVLHKRVRKAAVQLGWTIQQVAEASLALFLSEMPTDKDDKELEAR